MHEVKIKINNNGHYLLENNLAGRAEMSNTNEHGEGEGNLTNDVPRTELDHFCWRVVAPISLHT